jgi:hypothetical protein
MSTFTSPVFHPSGICPDHDETRYLANARFDPEQEQSASAVHAQAVCLFYSSEERT